MTQSWDSRVAEVWAAADGLSDEAVLASIDALVAERTTERGADDPAALFESASVRDYLGRESDAEPLYRAAIAAGLDGERRPQAVIQLASTLRNLGRAEEAVALLSDHLERHAADEWTAPGAAFLALALVSAVASGTPHPSPSSPSRRAFPRTRPRYAVTLWSYAATDLRPLRISVIRLDYSGFALPTATGKSGYVVAR